MTTDKTTSGVVVDRQWRGQWDSSPAPASLEDRDRESRLEYELRLAIAELERMHPEDSRGKLARTVALFVLGDGSVSRFEAMTALLQIQGTTQERTEPCR